MQHNINFFGTAQQLKDYTSALAWLEAEAWEPVDGWPDEHH
ncbi:MAG: hypothetical protein P4L74_02470 [Candidatus Doudnabacteria bacterium]|nr:hypothetical protein [Candidatus Doudnabacteria bacterium]